jgi:hypothetical protein
MKKFLLKRMTLTRAFLLSQQLLGFSLGLYFSFNLNRYGFDNGMAITIAESIIIITAVGIAGISGALALYGIYGKTNETSDEKEKSVKHE